MIVPDARLSRSVLGDQKDIYAAKWWPRSLLTTEVACFCWRMQFVLCSLPCRQARRQVGSYVVWMVLLVTMHFALCSLLLFSGPDAYILAGMDQKDSCTVHPCRGAEAYSHGLLFRRPLRFSCDSSTRWSMSLLHRPVQVPLYLVVTCTVFGVRLWSTRLRIFPGRFQEIFMYSALSGSTVDTCRCQSSRLLVEFHTFYT